MEQVTLPTEEEPPLAAHLITRRRGYIHHGLLRARSRLGENRYDIFRNNCEHFCEWCLSGVSRSRQLESLPARLGAAAIAILDAIATRVYRTRQLASL
jgi:hypothetical protein